MKIKSGNTFLEISNKPFDGITDVLWSITEFCNQNCIYCFESLKNKNILSNRCVSTSNYFTAVNKLHSLGYKRIHFCGGEALLANNILDIIKYAANYMECVVITNLSYWNNDLFELFNKECLKKICISLDSLNENINNYLRGNTRDVILNFIKLMDYINNNSINIQVEVLCTITQKNINSIRDLLLWCKKIKVNNVSLNPVALSEKHPFYDELALESIYNKSDFNEIKKLFLQKKYLFGTDVKDEMITTLLEKVLTHEKIKIFDCPTNNTHQYMFIDTKGNSFNCPLKKQFLGNIFDDSIYYSKQCTEMCDFSLQCLCYW